MPESEPDTTSKSIFDKVIKVSERLLDSDETANMLIITLVILAMLPVLGIGVILTRVAAPTNPTEISN